MNVNRNGFLRNIGHKSVGLKQEIESHLLMHVVKLKFSRATNHSLSGQMTLLLLESNHISHILSYCDGATIFRLDFFFAYYLALGFCIWLFTTLGRGMSYMSLILIFPTTPSCPIKSSSFFPSHISNYPIIRTTSLFISFIHYQYIANQLSRNWSGSTEEFIFKNSFCQFVWL